MFAERQAQILLAKPNLSLEKRLNVKVLFIKIKLKSLKHEKCFNVVSFTNTRHRRCIFGSILNIYNNLTRGRGRFNVYKKYLIPVKSNILFHIKKIYSFTHITIHTIYTVHSFPCAFFQFNFQFVLLHFNIGIDLQIFQLLE